MPWWKFWKKRLTIGFAKAIEKYSSKYFGNGAKTCRALEHPDNLSEDVSKRLRSS